MKSLLIFSVFCISSFQFYSQNIFKNKSLSGNLNSIFLHEKTVDDLSIIKLDTVNKQFPYGYITQFKSKEFISSNKGKCGNECIKTIKGKYKVKRNKIIFTVETITYSTDCQQDKLNTTAISSQFEFNFKQEDTAIILSNLKTKDNSNKTN